MWGYDLLHFLLFFFSLKLCVFRYCGCPFHFQYKDNMISHTILIFTSQDLGLEKSESQKCMSFLPSYWRYPYYYVPHLQNVCSNKCFGRFDLTLSTIKVQIASPLIQCRIFWRRKNYFPPSTYHHMFKFGGCLAGTYIYCFGLMIFSNPDFCFNLFAAYKGYLTK